MNPEPPSNERRAHPRTPCSVDSRIAPYKSGIPLRDLQFETVTLNDLSAGGFSFWTAQWPKYAELAFPLTDIGGAAVMLAHIRKVERIEGRCLVHCQFVRRLGDETD